MQRKITALESKLTNKNEAIAEMLLQQLLKWVGISTSTLYAGKGRLGIVH